MVLCFLSFLGSKFSLGLLHQGTFVNFRSIISTKINVFDNVLSRDR